MIDLNPTQAASRIAVLLAAHESRTLEFMRLGDNPRDYRLNRGIFIRIFDNRIEVEGFGAFPGSIANADLCRIARVDTLKASKILRDWVDQGVLVSLPDRGKRNMAYVRSQHAKENVDLLSDGFDNNGDKE